MVKIFQAIELYKAYQIEKKKSIIFLFFSAK